MDSDDELNQFVMDEIIDSSSSDDERKAVISGVVHLIVEDTLNHPGRIGSVEGHDFFVLPWDPLAAAGP